MKEKYVKARIKYALQDSIKKQMDWVKKGVYQIVAKDLVQTFSGEELGWLISGTAEDIENGS